MDFNDLDANKNAQSGHEYSKDEIKQAENVDILGFLSASYPDRVTVKENQLLFKNTNDETISINISSGDKHGLFFNTATQSAGKGIINFLRQETGVSFRKAVGALLAYSQEQPKNPELTEKQKNSATLHNERELNIKCGQAIDQAVIDNYTPGEMAGTGYYNSEAAIKAVVQKYGVDRVAMVLAANINAAGHDGRIANANKSWAKSITDSNKPDYHLNTHRAVLDSFADKFRETMHNIQKQTEAQSQASQNSNKAFTMPPKSETSQNAENYLTGKMSFDKGIVKSCISNGSVYQTEVFSKKLGKNLPCAVFAGFDGTGKIQSSVIKGFGNYEKIEAGSQLKHAFILPANENNGKAATAVSIFENPMELLAGATIAKLRNKASYSAIHRLAANQSVAAVRTFLENNPQVKTVNLCLTNTDKGCNFAEKISNLLENLTEERGESIKVNQLMPKEATSYQEMLQNKVSQFKAARKDNETRE